MALLRLEQVNRTYWRAGRPLEALRDVSLEVEPRHLVAVYGSRGAGKTTLLRIAAGFEAPDSGRVTFGNRDISRLSRREQTVLHHRHIAWVEGSGPHSSDVPVELHVALPLYDEVGRAEARRRAAIALARVGASDTAGQRWKDLWDGERIRVAIAQALVREPSVLVVDDPTRGLGIVERELVVGLLRSAAQEGGLAVLMAVPDMPSMLPATDVRLLTRGYLLAPGEPSKVIEFRRPKRAQR